MMRINLARARLDTGRLLVFAAAPLAGTGSERADDFEALVLATGRDLLSDHIERVFGGEGRTAAEIRALLARYIDERIAARRVA